MSDAPPPPHLISLRDVAERRMWCPFSGTRVQAPGDVFAPNSCCIGPRCAGWEWRSAADSREVESCRRYLVPPDFSPGYQVRLSTQLFPEIVEPLRVLATGQGGEPDAARAAILDWARLNWHPERDLPDPSSWQRPGIPAWDRDADTVVLDLCRTFTEDQRCGQCGLRVSVARQEIE